MELFQSVLILLTAAVVLSGVARRIGAPYPALLALAGAVFAFAPVGTPFRLDPELALALFVAPVLLDAAFDASLRDLKSNRWPLMGLVFVAVVLTTLGVAVVARWLLPDLPWAAAIALGAIVAPPDAAAATAVLRQVPMPHRLMVLLEGESLLNDASALIIYRIAVGAAVAGSTIGSQVVAPVFLISIVGSLVAGPVMAVVISWISRRIEDVPSSIVVQFIGTFGVWLAAEHLGMSPVLTVVAFAITAARISPARTPAHVRAPSYAVWETAVLVLNALAFVIVGLQLRPIIAAAPAGEITSWLIFAAAILATMIGVRFAWVMLSSVLGALQENLRPSQGGGGVMASRWKSGLVISWCGMRGIVTLATALALPDGFPHRDLFLFTASAVTLGTLVIQGLTLRPLLLRLALPDDRLVETEVRTARVELAAAALKALESDPSPEARALCREFEHQRDVARDADEGDGRARSRKKEMVGQTLAVRRDRLISLRREGVIGDEAFHRLEGELDVMELAAR